MAITITSSVPRSQTLRHVAYRRRLAWQLSVNVQHFVFCLLLSTTALAIRALINSI